MTERFGAWQVGDDPTKGKAEFKLFIPDRDKDMTQYQASRSVNGQAVPDFGAAKISSVRVSGSFQSLLGQSNWDFESAPLMVQEEHPKGSVWRFRTTVELPADFSEYKFFVAFEDGTRRKVGDPARATAVSNTRTRRSSSAAATHRSRPSRAGASIRET